jgi:hypothetical protein
MASPDAYTMTGYDIENWNGNLRYQFDAQISQQDLVEYYLPPFQSCARDSNVGAFMCSYSTLSCSCHEHLADQKQMPSMGCQPAQIHTFFRPSCVSIGVGQTRSSGLRATVTRCRTSSYLTSGVLLASKLLLMHSSLEQMSIAVPICRTICRLRSHKAS